MGMKERFKVELKKKNLDFKTLYYKITGNDPESYEKEKGNFSKMINGERPLPMKYILAIERILKKPILYFAEGDYSEHKNTIPFQLRNFEYVASQNNYDCFLHFDEIWKDAKGKTIIFNPDEFGNSLLHYIVQYHATEGIRYLANLHGLHYDLQIPSLNINDHFFFFSEKQIAYDVAELLVKSDECDLFFNVFDVYSLVSFFHHSFNKNRILYYNRDFLDMVIESNEFLEAICQTQSREIKTFYQAQRNPGYGFDTVELVCPLLTPVLERLVETYTEDKEKCLRDLLVYSIQTNEKIIEFFKEMNGQGQFRALKCDPDRGGIISDEWTVVGNMVIYPYPIDPSLPNIIKSKLNIIAEQMNKINFSERILWNGKKTKRYNIIGDNYVLTNHVDNEKMYQFYKLMNDKCESLIPTYIETKEGVDTFSYLKGGFYQFPVDDDTLKEMVCALKKIHDECLSETGGKVYVHGNGFEDSFIFLDGRLNGIVNWVDCYLGEIEEDLFMLIYENFCLKWRNDWEYEKIFESIKTILDIYGDLSIKKDFGKKMLNCIENKRKRLNPQATNYPSAYAGTYAAEAFTRLYYEKLNSL